MYSAEKQLGGKYVGFISQFVLVPSYHAEACTNPFLPKCELISSEPPRERRILEGCVANNPLSFEGRLELFPYESVGSATWLMTQGPVSKLVGPRMAGSSLQGGSHRRVLSPRAYSWRPRN